MTSAEQRALSPIAAMVGGNLGLLLVYTVIALLSTGRGPNASLEVAGTLAFFLLVHSVLLALVSVVLLIADRREWAKGGFLSIPVVLIIGFGSCIGAISLV